MAGIWLARACRDRPYFAEVRFDAIGVLVDDAASWSGSTTSRGVLMGHGPRARGMTLARTPSRSTASRPAASGWRPTSAAACPRSRSSGSPTRRCARRASASARRSTNSGYVFPDERITVNLAPAYLRKVGPGFDLPLAVALLAASGQLAPARRSPAARSSASCR